MKSSEPNAESRSVEHAMMRIAAFGPGVHNIVTSKNRSIASCLVVGHVQIDLTRSNAESVQFAQCQAIANCDQTFQAWLNSEATVFCSHAGDAAILTDGTKVHESPIDGFGFCIDKTTADYSKVVQCLCSNLQTLHIQVDGDTKSVTVVRGWKSDTPDGLKRLLVEPKSQEVLPEQVVLSTSAGSDGLPFPWGFFSWMALLLLSATFLVILFVWCLKWVGLDTASLWFIYLSQIVLGIGFFRQATFLWESVWTRQIKESKFAITLLLVMPFWISFLHLRGCHTNLKSSIAAADKAMHEEK